MCSNECKTTLIYPFYLKRKKAAKDGLITIYVRLTINGMENEFSMSIKFIRNIDKMKPKLFPTIVLMPGLLISRIAKSSSKGQFVS